MSKDNGNNGNGELSPIPNSPPPSPPTSRRPSNLGVDETLPSSNTASHPPSRQNSDVAPDEEPPLPPEGQDDLTPEGQDGLPPIPVYPDFTDEPTQPFTESSSFSFKPSTSTDQLGLTSELLAEHNLVAETFFASPVDSPSQSISDKEPWESYRGNIFGDHSMLNPVLFDALVAFCGRELSPENVNFLIEYENYERLRSLTKPNFGALRNKFIQMYNTFISSGGESQINISSKTKTALDRIYQELNNGTLLPEYLLNNDVFLGVVTEIRNLLGKDTYGRFKLTKEYKEASKASIDSIVASFFGEKVVAHFNPGEMKKPVVCMFENLPEQEAPARSRRRSTIFQPSPISDKVKRKALGEAAKASEEAAKSSEEYITQSNFMPSGLYIKLPEEKDSGLQIAINRQGVKQGGYFLPLLAFKDNKFYYLKTKKSYPSKIKLVLVGETAASGTYNKVDAIEVLRSDGYELYQPSRDRFLCSVLSELASRPLKFKQGKLSAPIIPETLAALPLGSYIKNKGNLFVVVNNGDGVPAIIGMDSASGLHYLNEKAINRVLGSDSDIFIPQTDKVTAKSNFVKSYTSTIASLVQTGVSYDAGKDASEIKTGRRASSITKFVVGAISGSQEDSWIKSLAKFYGYKEAYESNFGPNHLSTHASALFTFAMQMAYLDRVGGKFDNAENEHDTLRGRLKTQKDIINVSEDRKENKKTFQNVFKKWYDDKSSDIEPSAAMIHPDLQASASHITPDTFVRNIIGVDPALFQENAVGERSSDASMLAQSSSSEAAFSRRFRPDYLVGEMESSESESSSSLGTPRGVPPTSTSSREAHPLSLGKDPKTPRGWRG